MIHLDTHVVVWLYVADLARFPAAVLGLLESEPLAISPMVQLELQYLHEVGKTTQPAAVVVAALQGKLGLRVADLSFAAVASAATELSWTRDPFDRLIAASALVAGCPLLTADTTVLRHLPCARWS